LAGFNSNLGDQLLRQQPDPFTIATQAKIDESMPELPEVETMCRGIASVVGKQILAAGRVKCNRKPIHVAPEPEKWKKFAVEQVVQAVSRIGKRVVLELANRFRIVFEPRMTGLVLLADPPSQEHLRFEVRLSDAKPPLGDAVKVMPGQYRQGGQRAAKLTTAANQTAAEQGSTQDQQMLTAAQSQHSTRLLFWDRRGLGSVRLFSEVEFAQTFLSGQVGVDALEVTVKQLARIFADCRQAIKPALLLQKKLAGVGNLYASELLFNAKVSPTLICQEISSAQWRRIHKEMLNVLLQAIAYEGSTLGDGTYRNALNQEGGYQNHHRVYAREGKPCPRCHKKIVRIVQTQRATFYCPKCQR